MSNRSKLLIYDWEYEDAAKYIPEYCNALLGRIEKYNQCIQEVTETAIQDQAITNSLLSLAAMVKSLEQQIYNVGEELKTNCGIYIKEIDKADKFLY